MDKLFRRTWAEIDLDALAHNFRLTRAAADPKAQVCCVVKADAYGHGAVRVARELEALGADWFAVSNPEEALQLRRGGIAAPILILGYTPPEEARSMAENRISLCCYSAEYAAQLSRAAQAAGVQLHVHIKVDTGMSRLGFCFQDLFRDEASVEEIHAACALPGLLPEGIFTHFAVSDEGAAGDAFTMQQFGCFKEMIESLQRCGVRFPLRHCANSAAVFDYPLSHLDMVRAGIVLYGLPPSGALRARPDLRPVLSLRSVVSHVKTLLPGATVSYGRQFTARQTMQVATVPIGYADGYPRALAAGGGWVLLHGRRCPILGRICMDQLMVDVTGLPEVSMGDTVTLIGADGGETLTADDLARWENTIPYEVVCGLSKRVPRVYWKNGVLESVYDPLLQGE